jgi:inosine-uridine nucleoside N-ribohydrolase
VKLMTRSGFAAALIFAGLVVTQVSYAGMQSDGTPQRNNAQDVRKLINVIFDTDMWLDIDDALALAMLHALQDRHEINLVAVTVSTDLKWCASYVDLVDTFYGHSQVPVGLVSHGFGLEEFRKKVPETAWPALPSYTEILSQESDSHGSLVYPHRLIDGRKAPEAVSLLRKILAAQPDGSVVIIQVGYSTNLARLLESGSDAASALNGRDLVRRKVRLLSVMGGSFTDWTFEGRVLAKGSPDFNLTLDIPSAQKLFAGWPTPIVASGAEIGVALPYPVVSIERDFSYVDHHPIAETYRRYAQEQSGEWPYYRPTWDLTSVLYAVRPDRNYFTLSKPGRITVLADGGSRFDESEGGPHRYLVLTEEQKARALEAMVMLVSQPPTRAATRLAPRTTFQ